MSRHGTVLPIPDAAQPEVQRLIELWPHPQWPTRSVWLGTMEALLRNWIPGRSSRDYNLTARSLAPFPLAERDWL